MIKTNSRILYSVLVKEFQEVLVQSLNTNFKNIEIKVELSREVKSIPIYFDYNNKKILVGGNDPNAMSLKFIFYSKPIFKVNDFFLNNGLGKEEIIQILKESILKDEVFLDYFEEKTYKVKRTLLYEKLIYETKLTPILKLLINTLPYDKQNSNLFWNTMELKSKTEYIFSKKYENNEVINYIREVIWKQLLNEQKESLNRCLSISTRNVNTSIIDIYTIVDIYKKLLYLTYFSETVKETELYKEALGLFKQYTFESLGYQKGKEKITIFCEKETLEELSSYTKSSGSIDVQEFWQLLSETLEEELEVKLKI